MKLSSSFCFLLTLLALISSCATRDISKQKAHSLSSEQIDQMNRDALAIASDRLGDMVKEAKSNSSSSTYLATDLFLKGNMSLLEGDYATASVLFKHLTFLVPEDEFLQKKYAISLIRVGDLETAETVLTKLYQKSRDEKVGLILAGVHTSIDQESKARKIYRELLVKYPTSEDACIFLSKSLAIGKETSAAIKQLKTCAARDSQNGMYDYYIGKIYLDQGKLPAATEAFKSAFKRQPNLGQAVSALGIILEEREDFDGALSVYEKYLNKFPNDQVILTRIVQLLFLKEKYFDVIPYAERLSDIEPENLNLKVKLGILYTDTKKYGEAISIFKDLLQAAPQSDKILYYLGAIHQELTQFEESIEYFNQIPPTSGLYTDSSVQMATMLSSLAQAEFFQKDGTEWKEKFLQFTKDKLAEIKDMVVEFSVIKAGFYEGIGAYKEAMETMMVVQEEKNFSTQHKYYLANLYEKEKKFDESTSLIMSIIEKEPRNAHAWNFLGYSLLVRGEEMDKAFEYIQEALKISPDDGYIRDSLGWYYFKQGEIKKALAELEFAVKKVPNDIEILKHLAIVHKELKDFSRARKFFESALKQARYQGDREEILGAIEQLESDRLPASGKLD